MKEQRKAVAITRHKIAKGCFLVKKETWYSERCSNGVQKRRSLGTTDIDEAKPEEEPAAAITPSSALKDYLEGLSGTTARAASIRTKPLVKSFVAALGNHWIGLNEWVELQSDENRQPDSTNSAQQAQR